VSVSVREHMCVVCVVGAHPHSVEGLVVPSALKWVVQVVAPLSLANSSPLCLPLALAYRRASRCCVGEACHVCITLHEVGGSRPVRECVCVCVCRSLPQVMG
jgi:hypothetical protein